MSKFIFYGTAEPGSELEKAISKCVHVGKQKNVHLSVDYWLHPDPICGNYKEQGLPAELEALIDKWREDAAICLRGFEACWYEKSARLKFICGNKFYIIGGAALDLSSEEFGAFSVHMEKDLDRLGCPFHAYTGMID